MENLKLDKTNYTKLKTVFISPFMLYYTLLYFIILY